jgi:hypothetical protein
MRILSSPSPTSRELYTLASSRQLSLPPMELRPSSVGLLGSSF